MKIHNLESYTGVELASFGETQAAIRHRLSNLPRIVVGENDSVSHDYYPDLGMHVHYEAGVCVFLEFGPPAYPLYQGVQLLYRPFSDVLRELLKLDEAPELNRSGLRSTKLGISIYAPGSVEGQSERVESVSLFCASYYRK